MIETRIHYKQQHCIYCIKGKETLNLNIILLIHLNCSHQLSSGVLFQDTGLWIVDTTSFPWKGSN